MKSFFLFACIALLSGCSLVSPTLDPSIYNAFNVYVSNSTFKIKGTHSQGTGFFVIKKNGANRPQFYLITCAHVVEKEGEVDVYFRAIAGKTSVASKVYSISFKDRDGNSTYFVSPKYDIAAKEVAFSNKDLKSIDVDNLIQYDQLSTNDGSDVHAAEVLFPGDPVFFWGYPLGASGNGANTPILRSGTVASRFTMKKQNVDNFYVSTLVFPGDSGSPVFTNKQGHIKIIGILYASSLGEDSSKNRPLPVAHVIPGKCIKDFIDSIE